MMPGGNPNYFSDRAAQEFAAAEAASSETAAAIHRELAERFKSLAEQEATADRQPMQDAAN
jgi:hypothetical protein